MFAVVSETNCNPDLLFGIDYESHLGTEFGGMAVLDNELVKRIHNIRNSQFKTAFLPDMHILNGKMGIGTISAKDEQPLVINPVNKSLGFFVICTFGHIDNVLALNAELQSQGIDPEWEKDDGGNPIINTTKLVGILISQSNNLTDGITSTFDRIDGSISLLILNTQGIYAARAKFGHSPLHLGQKEGSWAVTMETSAFPNLGYKIEKSFGPGEIILLSQGKRPAVLRIQNSVEKLCPFFSIYTSFPAAESHNMSAELYRNKTGGDLAKADIDAGIKADAVVGVPDSGVGYAVGYARATSEIAIAEIEKLLSSNPEATAGELTPQVRDILNSIVSYSRPIVKYTPGWGRSYTPTDQEIRDMVAAMKLIPVRDVLNSILKLIMTEDSIVRGTQLREYIRKLVSIMVELWGIAPPEIHVRAGCPPLAWPCKFMLSTRTTTELAARQAVADLIGEKEVSDEVMKSYLDPNSRLYQQMLEQVAENLGVKSVGYQTLEKMLAITGPNVCTYCWTGEE